MSGDLRLSTDASGGCAVVTVHGEIDLGSAHRLSDAALAALQQVGSRLVLDLAGVSFMDSTGLKVLLALHKRAQVAGGRLLLAGPTRTVLRVLTVTGLDQAFEICDTVDAAVAALATGGAAPAAASD